MSNEKEILERLAEIERKLDGLPTVPASVPTPFFVPVPAPPTTNPPDGTPGAPPKVWYYVAAGSSPGWYSVLVGQVPDNV